MELGLYVNLVKDRGSRSDVLQDRADEIEPVTELNTLVGVRGPG
jgi:hypothetical protein